MISRNLYFNLLTRIIIIVVLSLLLGYLVFQERSFRFSIICSIIILVSTINLIYYLNSTNRKIRFFFDSIKNDDSSLTFSMEKGNKSLNAIYDSMNRVNEQVQQLKIENRRQELFFQVMLEHLAAGIITYNSDGFIIHSNSPARRYLSVEVLTHLKQIERVDKKLYSAIMEIKPEERRLISLAKENQGIQLSLRATSFQTGTKDLIILSVQDIKNELDEKELESWMKLIRVLMHEIMNSITPITSLSDSLLKVYSENGTPVLPEKITAKKISTAIQGLTVIKEQGKGLLSFVESYRKLTHIPQPDKKLFRVDEFLNRILTLYNSMAKKAAMEIVVSVKNPDLEIFADQNLISMVLLNLLKNAMEANENNQEALISIVAGKGVNGHPEICVIDNGPGIEENMLDQIFIPFFTTRKNGSGIGLSISKQIMRIHGGNLKVKSVPGKETNFCLSF